MDVEDHVMMHVEDHVMMHVEDACLERRRMHASPQTF